MHLSFRPYGLYLQFLVLFFSCSGAQAQSGLVAARGALAEKIYLQVDADVYSTDQTIWFKAVVLESAGHLPSGLSAVLYVDLISPDEQVIAQKRVRLNHGIGQGSIELSDRMSRGTYLLRAYTQWNGNFGNDFFFHKYVRIFPPSKGRAEDPMPHTTIVEEASGSYRLEAGIFPRLIDPGHSGQLDVYLSAGGDKDSILLRQDRQGHYRLDHPLPSRATTASICIQTRNGVRYTKTVVLPHAPADLQFFPEGGGWLAGVPTKVAFKALDNLGQGLPVSGRIVDERGQILGSFRSNHLGMGSLELLGDADGSYRAVPDSMPGVSLAESYPLPRPQAAGHALHIRQQDGRITATVYDRTTGTDSLYLQVSSRGILLRTVGDVPHDGQLRAVLSKGDFPEGILRFTLLDRAGRPLAERLCFNQRANTRLDLELSTDRVAYGKRERTDVNIRVRTGEGRPALANVSLMAVHADHIGGRRALRENILTHLLLQSELRGEVAEPNRYFRQDTADRSGELDDLLLTQGWRQYRYDAPPDMELSQPNEPELVLSGEVTGGAVVRRKQEGAAISLLTFGDVSEMQVQQTDSMGRFRFPLELYTDSAEVLLQSADAEGKNRNYSFAIDSVSPPGIDFDHTHSAVPPDSTAALLMRKREERVRIERGHRGAIEIEEVIVERRVRTPQEQKVFERFGPADTVLSGKAIQGKERKWHWGLYSVLQSDFPDILRIERERFPYSEGSGYHVRLRLRASLGPYNPERSPDGITLVVVDGIPVRSNSYDLIQFIPPDEVKNVEFIKFAKGIAQLYSEVKPTFRLDEVPRTGHVLAIYTHAGRGLYQALKPPPGVLQATVPVYSPIVEFYAPRYASPEERDSDSPDLRTLLHWAPQIVTGPEGRATLHYYNGDTPGEVTVIAEAVSPEGEIGYRELVYTVGDGP